MKKEKKKKKRLPGRIRNLENGKEVTVVLVQWVVIAWFYLRCVGAHSVDPGYPKVNSGTPWCGCCHGYREKGGSELRDQ